LLVYGGARGIQILPNAGNGTFDIDRVFKLNQFVSDTTLVDFNRDGKIDVATCGDGLKVFEGTGDGTLTPGLSSLPDAGGLRQRLSAKGTVPATLPFTRT
jgi:hypothetical protein